VFVRICDLPGQCRSEGKCHHPRAASPQATATQPAQTERALTDDARDAAPYRWAIEIEDNASTLHSIVLCHEGETEKIGERVDEYRAALSRRSQVAMS
jgi:hypothetical protein